MLLILIALHVLKVSHGLRSEKVTCDGIMFNDVYYDREVLVEKLGSPYNLFIHKASGTLFFTHTIRNGSVVDFEIIACKVHHKCGEVHGIPGGYAIAYDSDYDEVYFGGHDGIYRYNFHTKSAEFFAEDGKSIWGLFVRKNFYYIAYPSQKLYIYRDDKFVQVAKAEAFEIDHFFVSKHGNIYFANETALYKVEKQNGSTILLNDQITLRQIVDDSDGDIYVCANDGIYHITEPSNTMKKIAKMDNVFGLTFDDKNNVVYSDKYAIYRLIPSKYSISCAKSLNKVFYIVKQ